jgi:uncharacterized protein YcfJ
MKSFKSILSLLVVFALLFSACQSSRTASTSAPRDLPTGNGSGERKDGMSRTAKGGIIGAGGGAVAGGVLGRVIGGKSGTAAGAIIGATVGGATGAIIGRKMDKQAEELQRDMKNARVERVGEGIKITFDAGILFDTNKSDPARLRRRKFSAWLKC